ncbi:MAG: penicillin-binding transpeptidase domain-containing protein [bacterium]|nr:penicillin-binding transpeptidase domain-containing protein [bacterium]
MPFTKEINRLLVGLLVGLGLIVASALYHGTLISDRLLEREDNARLFEQEAALLRGSIYDRNGALLVASLQDEDGFAIRRYYYPELNSAVGYASLRYGVGGIEAAYNTILRGDDLPYSLNTYLSRDVLHYPGEGADVLLTLDLATQRTLVRLMQDYQGAAVVLSVPEGEVLALVSLPTFDPNTLELSWNRLRRSQDNPFFNRAVQGKYQPGSLLYTPLMAAAIANQVPLNTLYEDATRAVAAGEVTLSCAETPPSDQLTLAEAYFYGCPAPFATLIEQLGLEEISRVFRRMQLAEPYPLPGYTPLLQSDALQTATPNPTVTPAPGATDAFTITLEDALGQGALTVTPLRFALLMLALASDGNAVAPHMLYAARPPSADAWSPVTSRAATLPLTTAETAHDMRDLLQTTVEASTVRRGQSFGGATALAYSGNQTNVWFAGYGLSPLREGVVVVLVVEDTDDLALAEQIGLRALTAALAAGREPNFPID